MQNAKDGMIIFASKGEAEILPMLLYKKPKAFRKNYIVVGDLIKPDMDKSKDKEYADEFTKLVVDSINDLRHKGEQMLCKKKWKI